MKNISLLLLIIIFIGSSCSKNFLDESPKGKLMVDGFFRTGNDLEMGVTAMYNQLHAIGGSDHEMWIPFQGADDLASNKSQPQYSGDVFNLSNVEGDLTRTWTIIYGMVTSSNFVINGYSLATEATEEQRKLAAGQAYFMRAFAYFNATRFYGCVPLITTNPIDLKSNKSTPEAVYALVIEDLKKAETMLPDKWTNDAISKLQRPTAGLAKALLASAYLHRAGWPVNGGIADYALAAAKAKEVVDGSSEPGGSGLYTYRLLENYKDLWVDKQTNDELMFGTFYDGRVGSERNVRAPLFGAPSEEGGWDVYFSEINFFKAFPAGPRKDATFQTYARKSSDNGVHVDTIPWENFSTHHPYYHKMRSTNGKGDGSPTPIDIAPWSAEANMYVDGDRTTVIMRYAEVMLIYAEAQAMADGGPNADAYNQLNRVRARAGLNPLSGLSQIAFRDSVVAERGWEFAGPEFGQRWFDLVRLELVESANGVGSNPIRTRDSREAPFINVPSKARYFTPIPNKEVNLDPNLAPGVAPVNPQ